MKLGPDIPPEYFSYTKNEVVNECAGEGWIQKKPKNGIKLTKCRL